jgi:hypothetical protein
VKPSTSAVTKGSEDPFVHDVDDVLSEFLVRGELGIHGLVNNVRFRGVTRSYSLGDSIVGRSGPSAND